MKKLAILGLGHVGGYVYRTLSDDTRFNVSGHDLTTGVDLKDKAALRRVISSADGVLASTPYYLNKAIAEVCSEYSVDYFDLTESVEVTDHVKGLGAGSKFVTQCGLAPGMVSIIAGKLASDFLKSGGGVESIQIRVGALPQNSNNKLGYYRTWNTEGLINEYIHGCPAVKDGVLVNLHPVADREYVSIGGKTLEAANTSGGIGSLAETYAGVARNVNYKTLRYPGHWDHISFLKDDLGLAENFNTYVELFNKHLPVTEQDVIYILINVVGRGRGGVQEIKQYCKEITSSSSATAIQISTASGVMAVLDAWNSGLLDSLTGWIKQEDLDYGAVWGSKYADPYK